ncbi:MAG: SH3 domain-containing protein [Chloroflexota bacterium]
MSRKLLTLLMFIAVLVVAVPSVLAMPESLPPSAWYAVAYVPETNTLHWLNADGEQASIERPTWVNENPNFSPRLHITPNGRTLIQVVQDTDGVQHIGFYDLESGQLLVSHQAQIGERFMWSDDYPSTLTGSRFAIGLSNPNASEWRVLVFNSATGNALAQITSDEANVNVPADTYFPYVMLYSRDDALNTYRVMFHLRTITGEFESFTWTPEGDVTSFVNGGYFMSPSFGYDIDPVSGQAIQGSFTGNAIPNPPIANTISGTVNGQGTQLIVENGASISDIAWLRSTAWVGYQYTDEVFAPHWRVGLAEENMNPVPLGPNFINVYATPDGFLAKDGDTTALQHATSLPEEGFTTVVGDTIFTPGFAYEVIYVTPATISHDLPSVENNVPIANDDLDLVAPDLQCDGAPETRLSVGMRARVTFTDGTALRLRNAPFGDILTELQEGTEFDVIGGPECNDGFVWWQISTDDNLVGWSAEGDSDDYYIEQVLTILGEPVQATPDVELVLTPIVIAATPEIAVVTPMPIAPVVVQVVPAALCTNSPPTRVAVGDTATTVTDGTLAMRTNLADEFPSNQIPGNTPITILEGPACNDNLQRMWRVRATVNNQQVEGWIAEGVGANYFIDPN